MLDALEPIYNTLYDVIDTEAGVGLSAFERGFWYKVDCTQNLSLYPYAFLDQPETSEVKRIRNPAVFGYVVRIPLVVLTYNADQGALYFNERNMPDAKGAVEWAYDISQFVWNKYIGGLPFEAGERHWQVARWTLGPLQEPRLVKLRDFFKNPYIAGATVSFVFEVVEQGPLPVRAGG